MRRDLLFAAMSAAFGSAPKVQPKVRVVAAPQFTNHFGAIDEIAGKELQLLERNSQGDCLCLFTGKLGQNIVDVDHRDIQK